MAVQLRAVAQHHVKVGASELKAITALVERVAPPGERVMGQRNRERLKPFDDAAVVQHLLLFPGEEVARAMRLKNPLRRAKGIERALAIALLLSTGLRAKTLRSLRLDHHVQRRGSRTFLSLSGSDMKTGNALDLELPAEITALLDRFVAEHRSELPGSDALPLPRPRWRPAIYSAMREAVSKTVRRHAGIELSLHLFRHIIAKVVVEREPGLINDVSRMLGHKSVNTTYGVYLGTETPAASRRINRLLQATREHPELEKKA